jgi:hypothetical protein
MGHSEIGPSSAERWVNCPGSVRLSKGLPRTRSSQYAAWGTVCHDLSEQVLKGKVSEMDLMLRIGEVVEEDGNDITIDEEMVQTALGYAANVRRDEVELLASKKPAPVHVKIEEKVSLRSVDEELYGRLDAATFRKGDVLLVRDLKTGKGKKVWAKENWQLSIYALAAAETFEVPLGAFDRVELIVDQPRAGGEDRWVAPRDWLLAFQEKLRTAVAATKEPDAPLKAGEWCRWCKAAAVCPEIVSAVNREAQADFDVVPPAPVTPAVVEAVPPWKLARILDWEENIKALLGAAYLRVQQLLESGVDVPGYKLVDGRTTRRWADGNGEEAARLFAAQYGDKVFAPRKVLSVAQMEAMVGKKPFTGLAGHLVVKPAAPKKVAPASDPRPDTGTSAQADFAEAGHIIEGEVVHGDPLFALPAPEPEPAADPFFAPAVKRVWP